MSHPTDIDTLWDFNDPAASERRFLDRLAVSAGEPPEVRAEIMTQAARAQGLQRRFDEAHRTLDGAEPLAGAARARVRLLLERGRAHNSAGVPGAARPLFLEAWTLARTIRDDGLAVDAAHMLAIVEPGEQSLHWNEQGLALARASDQPAARRWLGSLYNNIGWTCHDLGRLDESLAMFRAALVERERAGTRGPLLVARWAVARCLRSLGRFEEALAAQRALLAEHERAGTNDGFVHEEVAENLTAMGRGDEARAHFERAHSLLSGDPWFVQKEPARLSRMLKLGGAGVRRGPSTPG